ncbi:lanthionine synthetase LanC family protein [Mucilaginibacter puniceus]
MNKIIEEELLKNAIEIGEEIIDKAIIDSHGIHWKTVNSVNSLGDLEMDVDETISTGVSGIILFYIELYKATNSETYLEYINSSANWLINHCQKKPATHGFYSGRMGTIFTLFKIAETTQQEYHHAKAAEIALQFKDISSVPIQNVNLYNGIAGSVLGLLYLHIQIKENWILDAIDEGIEHILKNVKSNSVGFYWDNGFAESRSISTKPLCSMPLGSSGIALLFLHLSNYFDNKDYEYIAMQALKYEDQYYDTDQHNWSDLRIDLDHKSAVKLRKSYLKGKDTYFKSNNYSANWMYGIVGHSFTRLLANDMLKDKYSEIVINGIERELKANDIALKLSNYTLATGKGGLGLLFLILSHSKRNQNFFDNALALAKRGIDERAAKKIYQFGFNIETEYEDDSLLMGNAGIGYFYLKILNRDMDCILFPTLNTPHTKGSHKVYNFNKNYAVDKIALTWYPNTFSAIEDKFKLDMLDLNLESLQNSLTSHILQTIERLQNPQADDAFKYDKTKLKIQNVNDINWGHFKACRTTEVSKNENLLESNCKAELMKIFLKLNPYSYFLISKWNWKNTPLSNISDTPKEIYTLFSLGEEFTLSSIQYKVLSGFKTPQRVNSIYKIFTDNNELTEEDPDYLLHLYFDTIRFFMSNGVLTSVKLPLFNQSYLNHRYVFNEEIKTSRVS